MSPSARAGAIVMVGMEPKVDTDADFDDWYRKQVDTFLDPANHYRGTPP